MKFSLLLGLIVAVLLSGCAQLNTVARDFNVNEGTGQLIDAKQRAIIVVKDKDTNETVVCAEPSPDALSAYAMQLGLEGSIPSQGALKLAAASQESSAYIGLRTQSIQLLRDAMYRNCEAYANGAIDKAQYGIATRRHQRSMVALLAIEQLTGAVRVPPITITTEGAAEVAKSISELQSEADAINEEIIRLTKEIDDTKLTGKTAVQIKALDEKKASLENQKSDRVKNKEAITKGIENARGVMVTGKTYAMVSGDGVIHRSDQHIKEVADTVYKIFENLNGADDFTQLCGSYLIPGNKTDNNSTTTICEKRLEQMINANNVNINNNKNLVNAFINILLDENRSLEIRKELIRGLFPFINKYNSTQTAKSVIPNSEDATIRTIPVMEIDIPNRQYLE